MARAVLGLVGGAFLVYLAWRTMTSRPEEVAVRTTGPGSSGRSLSIFGLTMTNPMTILSFAAIFAGLGVVGGGGADAALLTFGVFCGSASWWVILTAGMGLPSRLTRTRGSTGSGAVLLVFGIGPCVHRGGAVLILGLSRDAASICERASAAIQPIAAWPGQQGRRLTIEPTGRATSRPMDETDTAQRIVAIVPIGALENAKSRLGGTLDAEERRDLVDTMIYRTIRATLATPGIAETLVISPDREALEPGGVPRRADDAPAQPGPERRAARGAGRRDRRRRRRDRHPADRPAARLARRHRRAHRAARRRRGAAARRPRAGPPRPRHERPRPRAAGRDRAGVRWRQPGGPRGLRAEAPVPATSSSTGPLGLDLDTPDDLLLVEALAEQATEVLETADAG